MSLDNSTKNYRIQQLNEVSYSDEYGRTIVLKSSGGSNRTKNLSITEEEYQAICKILLHEL
ncbi:MAG: hypothetical protein WAT79_08380 [Saprospiraceae bacterium]